MDVELQSPAQPATKNLAKTASPNYRLRTSLTNTLIHAVLILASFISAFPLLLIFFTSLKPENEILSTHINIFPQHWTLANYTYVLHDSFFMYAKNSATVAILTMITALIVAMPAAYALSRYEFLGKQGVLLTFLVTQMFPAPLLLVPLYALFIKFGLLNNLNGLVIAYVTTALPFSVWMLKNFFDTVPRELDQAAMVDGLTPPQVFYRVIAPLTIPGIAVVAFYNFMNSWNEFMFANLLVSTKDSLTLPLGLRSYVFATGAHWQWLTAYAVLVTIPVMGFFFWAQRYLISGLTGGSVKG